MTPNYQDKLIQQVLAGRRMVVSKYGSGKSRIAGKAAERLSGTSGLVVVACPPRNVKGWMDEIIQWLGAAAVEVDPYAPELAHYERQRRLGTRFLVIRHKQIPTIMSQLEWLKPEVIVYDESTIIKNPRSRYAENAHKLAKALPLAQRLCLTGDPTPEHPAEIWSQFQFCYAPNNPLGRTYYSFLNHWFIKADYHWALRFELTETFNTICDMWAVRMDEFDEAEHQAWVDTSESYQTILYSASEQQHILMKQLYTTWSLPRAGAPGAYTEDDEYWHTMSILHKSMQIANGFYYSTGLPEDESGKLIRLKDNPKALKLAETVRVLLAHGHKRIVVWYYYKADLYTIQVALATCCPPLLGTSTDLTKFSEVPGPRDTAMVIALSKASARGINDLKTASVDIFFSNSFKQEIRNQAEKRLPRPGNPNKKVLHIDLACEDLADHRVVFALQTKTMTEERANTIVTEILGGAEAAL